MTSPGPSTDFTLHTQGGSVSFALTGCEPGPAKDGSTWLYATVAVRLEGRASLSLVGECALTTSDLVALSSVLERLGRPRVGRAGRLATWCTSDDEVELEFAWHGDAGHVCGHVAVAGSGGAASMSFDELAMTRGDLERTQVELAAARARVPSLSRRG